MLLAALGGCVSADRTGPQPGQFGGVNRAREVAGMQGPYGEPVPVTTVKLTKPAEPKKDTGVVQAGASMPAAAKKDDKVVPANATMPATARRDDKVVQAGAVHVNKGMTSGVVAPPPGAVAAVGALPGIPVGGMGGMGHPGARTSIRFTTPVGMKVAWFAPSPASVNGFTPTQLEVPGRYNFLQGGVYRLKLSDIPNRGPLELYPTLEVMPANARTSTFLAHSAVPIGFTEEDFEQVAAGNFVIKVVYLPDPQFQDLAVAGPDVVVSTRLEPGVDPIMEAQRRGSVLAVIRMGNIDLEAQNTPPLHAPPQGGPFHGMPLQTAPGAVPPGMMPPPGTLPPGMQLPPGAVPLRPGQPLPPGAAPPTPMPPPGGVMMPPSNAGRASVSSPADPPGVRLPDAAAGYNNLPRLPGSASVSVDGMVGRMK